MQVSVKVGADGDFGSAMLMMLRELEERSSIRLAKVERLLLAEVGTVEQMLSILIDGPVSVDVLRQEEDIGEGIIEREVNICSHSGEVLMHATSMIDVDALPESVLEDIRARRLGIGSIIAKHRLETFRRIVEVGCSYMADGSGHREEGGGGGGGGGGRTVTVHRVYSIIYNGRDAFTIREEFISDVIRRLASLS
ncbi:MAG: chorismate pyruvate-lyase family protein [Candidatus Nitrosocaldus sp.]|nr:chorismate pyruvate-lyase family protein [Candidatus Nitrosocaldus sp.]